MFPRFVVIYKTFRFDRRVHVKKLKRAHKQEVQGVVIEMGRSADKAGNTIGGRREMEGSFAYRFPSRYYTQKAYVRYIHS